MVTFSVDRLEYRGMELHGEVQVTVNDKHVHRTVANLSRGRERWELANALVRLTTTHGDAERCPWPWLRLVEQFCAGVLIKEREGVPLAFTSPSDPRRREFLVDHLVMKDKTNLLIAPGGHGKGIIAVALTVGTTIGRGIGRLTVQKSTPIYFDWEDQLSDYEDRVNMLCRGLRITPPPIAYQRMHGTVPDRVHMMVTKIKEAEASFAVIDSMSAAMGTVGQGGAWDTIAQRFFDALDIIPTYDGKPMTWFIVGHVAGEGLKGLVGKAFGSIQIMNRARNAWEMRSTQEPGSSTIHMRLHDAKWNHTGLRKPIGFRMEWGQDTVALEHEDPDEVNVFGNKATMADKMEGVLLKGPLSVAMLALTLDVSDARIRATISQNKDRFERNSRGYIQLIQDEQPAVADGPLPW
jgi:AAA domain